MTWNYRLVRVNAEDVEICEVYYTDTGEPHSYATRSAGGTNRLDIEDALRKMFSALNKSVLEIRDGSLFDTRELLRFAPESVGPEERVNEQEGASQENAPS